MKQNIHPDYLDMAVTCACGNTFTVGGSRKTLHVDVCDKCHPFITGTQKFIDAMGRVDKFMAKRLAASGYVKKAKKGQEVVDKTPKSLKEMLDAKKKAVKAAPKAEATEVAAEV
jgi:large subunit ribosomal protein L31